MKSFVAQGLQEGDDALLNPGFRYEIQIGCRAREPVRMERECTDKRKGHALSLHEVRDHVDDLRELQTTSPPSTGFPTSITYRSHEMMQTVVRTCSHHEEAVGPGTKSASTRSAFTIERGLPSEARRAKGRGRDCRVAILLRARRRVVEGGGLGVPPPCGRRQSLRRPVAAAKYQFWRTRSAARTRQEWIGASWDAPEAWDRIQPGSSRHAISLLRRAEMTTARDEAERSILAPRLRRPTGTVKSPD